MRAIGTSKVLSWRWAPCVALVLGAFCFAAFAMLVIPERIGGAAPSPGSAAFRLDGNLASAQLGADSSRRFSNSDTTGSTSTTFSSLPSNQGASRSAANLFPKRGFTPPLERPEPPPAPPPVVPQQPALEVAPPQAAVQVPPPPDAPQQQQDPQSASLGPDQARPGPD